MRLNPQFSREESMLIAATNATALGPLPGSEARPLNEPRGGGRHRDHIAADDHKSHLHRESDEVQNPSPKDFATARGVAPFTRAAADTRITARPQKYRHRETIARPSL